MTPLAAIAFCIAVVIVLLLCATIIIDGYLT